MPRTSPCTIRGNVGREPVLKFTPKKSPVLNLDIALYAGKNAGGEQLTSWVHVTIWGALAELASKSLKKGQKVEVGGYLHPVRIYQTQGQEYGASLEMTGFSVGRLAEELQFEELGEGVS